MNTPAPTFQPVSKDALASIGTDPVPVAPYVDPAYFALEKEAIFKNTWIQIGHTCEVPHAGDFILRPFEAGDTSVLITRAEDNEIRAFHNVCPHRGTQIVSESEGHKTRFSCPYHGWTFSNQGDLIVAPDAQQFYIDPKSCQLPHIHVGVAAGFIFINLADEPEQTLEEYLGDLLPQLERLPHAHATHFTEYVYEVNANWKLTYDNFQENYHLRFIHPRSGAAAGGPENPFGYPTEYGFHDPHRTQRIWSNPNAKASDFQAFAFGKGARFVLEQGYSLEEKQYFGIFPNLFILSTAMTPFSQWILPITADRTRSIIRLYWVGADQNASHRFAREFGMVSALDIHSEDRAVIEAGHRGLASGALSHIHFQAQEVLCRHLFNQVDQRVRKYQAGLGVGRS